MSARVYKVTTPAGVTYVEANGQSSALLAALSQDVTVAVCGTSELVAAMKAGTQILTAVKPAAAQPEGLKLSSVPNKAVA